MSEDVFDRTPVCLSDRCAKMPGPKETGVPSTPLENGIRNGAPFWKVRVRGMSRKNAKRAGTLHVWVRDLIEDELALVGI